MDNVIVTYTGKAFDLLNPKPEMVCIEDIAHSLAYQCRYTGHTREFYSVAQHCVLMAENPDLPGDPLQKLLHDADEAYIGDMARPWKNLLQVNLIKNIDLTPHTSIPKSYSVPVRYFEDSIQRVIGQALGIDLNHSAEVKKADLIMMAMEIHDLMPIMPLDFDWGVPLESALVETIQPWGPELAETLFLGQYDSLTTGE